MKRIIVAVLFVIGFFLCGNVNAGLNDGFGDWVTNNVVSNADGSCTMTAIRNRTEYAYKPLNWDGLSDIHVSVDVKTTSGFSYAEYIKFGILPEDFITSLSIHDEPYRWIQFGYADGQSRMKAMVRLSEYSTAGMNPNINEWYTYSMDYDYSAEELTITFKDSSGTAVWSKIYSNVLFEFTTPNRIIGFFSYGMNSSYGNPSETIEIRNLQVDGVADNTQDDDGSERPLIDETNDNIQDNSVAGFVTRFYQQCLNREPDTGGLNNWENALNTGAKAGDALAEAFIFSEEFQNQNTSDSEFVIILYKAFFNREPDTGGYNNWIDRISNGTSRSDILDGFTSAQEFISLCQGYGISPNSPDNGTSNSDDDSERPPIDEGISDTVDDSSILTGTWQVTIVGVPKSTYYANITLNVNESLSFIEYLYGAYANSGNGDWNYNSTSEYFQATAHESSISSLLSGTSNIFSVTGDYEGTPVTYSWIRQ